MINKDIEKKLWKEAIFIFDTSVILDLYFYSDALNEKIFNSIFKDLNGRLFLPNHVYFEYHKNRKKVYKKPIQSYNNLIHKSSNNSNSGYIENIEKNLKDISGIINTFAEYTKKENKHPHLRDTTISLLSDNYKVFLDKFSQFKNLLQEEIETQIQKMEIIESKDNVLSAIDTFFNVGEKYDFKRMMEISSLGDFRYKYKIPPGYEDFDGKNNKEGFQIFGDLFIWFQIIDHSKKEKKPIILITGDNKRDWWEFDGKTPIEAPRFELIEELKSKSNVDFWMYKMDTFLHKTTEYLKSNIEVEDIKEVKEVQEIKDEKDSNKNPINDMRENVQRLFGNSLDIKINSSYEYLGNEINKSGNEIKTYKKKIDKPLFEVFDTLEVKVINDSSINVFFSNSAPKEIDEKKLTEIINVFAFHLGADDSGKKSLDKEDINYYYSKNFYQLFGRRWGKFTAYQCFIAINRGEDYFKLGVWSAEKYNPKWKIYTQNE